jgi:hypothetical protein
MPPGLIDVKLGSPDTATGVVLFVVVPLPSWPTPLFPQQDGKVKNVVGELTAQL